MKSGSWVVALRRPAVVVWCLFVLLNPLYIVLSGLPQPGDALVFPLALFSWDGKLDRDSARILRALLLFTIWVCVVNYGWASILWKWDSRKDFVLSPVWKPMHLQPVFADARSVRGYAASLFERGICLPSGSNLTADDRARVIATVLRGFA